METRLQHGDPVGAPSIAARPVTRVYVNAGVIAISPEDGRGGESVAVPGVADALAHLADGSHDVIVVGTPSHAGGDDLPPDVRAESVSPADLPPGSWLITDDADTCAHVARGVRTILVGPKRAPTHRPTARCDLEARDLSAAVIEILATEAMS